MRSLYAKPVLEYEVKDPNFPKKGSKLYLQLVRDLGTHRDQNI
jgi:hypothetical protein